MHCDKINAINIEKTQLKGGRFEWTIGLLSRYIGIGTQKKGHLSTLITNKKVTKELNLFYLNSYGLGRENCFYYFISVNRRKKGRTYNNNKWDGTNKGFL